MLTQEEIENHLIALRMAFDPRSPFRGMIDLHCDGGLMSLSIPEQHQVHNAMRPELKTLVFGEQLTDKESQ